MEDESYDMTLLRMEYLNRKSSSMNHEYTPIVSSKSRFLRAMASNFSFTSTYHSKTYPAIEPSLQEKNIKGKVVFITGGGSGIGRAIAVAFAKAKAASIVIIGRTKESLDAAKSEIESSSATTVRAIVADITIAADIQTALSCVASELGAVDIFVNNAGHLAEPAAVASASVEEWWKSFEVNCRGALLATQAFLSVASKKAIMINMSTAGTYSPPTHHLSAYSASKLAFLRVIDFALLENPELKVIHVHPGFIRTEMNLKSGIKEIPFDDSMFVLAQHMFYY
jgi:NAD(P)-dependent dehydrogenase (short-subunit alcohol dehydrogenase family)